MARQINKWENLLILYLIAKYNPSYIFNKQEVQIGILNSVNTLCNACAWDPIYSGNQFCTIFSSNIGDVDHSFPIHFDFMLAYSMVPQHTLTLEYALGGSTVLLNH